MPKWYKVSYIARVDSLSNKSFVNLLTLRVEHLCKYYGSHGVFEDVGFSHADGALGISGPNGSGKSTLMQCLAGLRSASSGHVHWQQNEQKIDLKSLHEMAGYAAPYINLYSELSCAENLDFILQLRAASHPNDATKKALKTTGIFEKKDEPFEKLSTGQQQRLRLAAALVHQPDILFLDEPGANLDEAGRELVETLADDFKKEGKLLFLASNNPQELELCDRVFSVEEERFL